MNEMQRSEESGDEGANLTVLLSGNEQSCYVYAARYAHGRSTGAAMQVVNTILHLWDKFEYRTQQQLKAEAEEAVCNKDDWQKLIDR